RGPAAPAETDQTTRRVDPILETGGEHLAVEVDLLDGRDGTGEVDLAQLPARAVALAPADRGVAPLSISAEVRDPRAGRRAPPDEERGALQARSAARTDGHRARAPPSPGEGPQ